MKKINKLEPLEIKKIINGLQYKKPHELNQIEKDLVYIFNIYHTQMIKFVYLIIIFHRYLPIFNTCIWFENKYNTIKNYIHSFFYF
jgi:hypothetical protein